MYISKSRQVLIIELSFWTRVTVRFMSTDQDWIRTEASFGRTGLDRTEKIFVVLMLLF